MISVTILTKNNEKTLPQVLNALTSFEEVVILDTGSSDTTLSIAKSYSNVQVFESPFLGFGPSHNLITSKARHDWILSIDSDEIVTDELIREIHSLSLDTHCVYSFCRKNYYRGRFIKGCGWWPDRVVRLYNRTSTSFTNDQVHEKVITDNLQVVKLIHPALHYPYKQTSDFLYKMQSYTTLFAEQNCNKKRSSFFKAITHCIFAFFRSYILKKGFLLGPEGFEISFYNANCAFYKYLKLRDANEQFQNKKG